MKIVAATLLVFVPLGSLPSQAAPTKHAHANAAVWPSTPRTNELDIQRRIDINRINMIVTNVGSFGLDIANSVAALNYPKGEATAVLFAGGLWVGTDAFGSPRVSVVEYGSEYIPGRIVSPGAWEDPNASDLKVYKVKRWTGDPADTMHVAMVPSYPTQDSIVHHAWSEYMAGAAPRGAPVRTWRLPNTDTPAPGDSVDVLGPDVSGDQMLWCVYNDANPLAHVVAPGGTAPIGLEVQQSVFGFDRPGALGDVVFMRYKIINRSSSAIAPILPAIWFDADIGDYTDDQAGSDVARAMAYAYNGDGQDALYGTNSPALGFRILRGLPSLASTPYYSGADPASAVESWRAMQGLHTDGSPIIDPVTQSVTRYGFPGNPITGAGWIDDSPVDKRALISAAPATLPVGGSYEFVVAIAVGRDVDHITSIAAMRCNSDFAAQAYNGGFTTLDPPAGSLTCDATSVCPRPLSFWQTQCTTSGVPLDQIARDADQQSTYFDWNNNPLSMCLTLNSAGTDARSEAERQFAALLANVMAARYGNLDGGGNPIILSPVTPVSCPGIEGTTVADLVRPGITPVPSFLEEVSYLNSNETNPQGLVGTGAGLAFFDGGAGYALELLGSTLNASTQPDSFSSVEVRFSYVPQKAYRYLRHERASDGAAPPLGRRYTYGGFRDVPFQVWDTDRNVQLDAAFVERVFTDDAGTILDPALQPASFDSTWYPTPAADGGFEYLVVLRNAYAGTPDPAFEVDGVVQTSPALYALAARTVATIDDSDLMRYTFGHPHANGIDQMLLDLALKPPGDPGALKVYAQISACIADLTSACDVVTATLATLVSATASPEAVELTWYAPKVDRARIERRDGASSGWTLLTEAARDGGDMITWTDRDVTPGARFGYRLVDQRGVIQGETWVDVPSAYRVTLAGVRPNPYRVGASVTLSLRSRAPAHLDVIDVAGRRVASRDVGSLGPGNHVLRVEELDRLPAGVYLLRVLQGAESATARIVRVQ